MSDVTRSTAEAMDVLASHRSELIAAARQVAVELATANGTVHSRQVYEVLRQRGVLADGDGNHFWLGAVFRSEVFRWTGEYHTYSDEERNIHERTVKVWKLRPGHKPSPAPPATVAVQPNKQAPEREPPRQLALFYTEEPWRSGPSRTRRR